MWSALRLDTDLASVASLTSHVPCLHSATSRKMSRSYKRVHCLFVAPSILGPAVLRQPPSSAPILRLPLQLLHRLLHRLPVQQANQVQVISFFLPEQLRHSPESRVANSFFRNGTLFFHTITVGMYVLQMSILFFSFPQRPFNSISHSINSRHAFPCFYIKLILREMSNDKNAVNQFISSRVKKPNYQDFVHKSGVVNESNRDKVRRQEAENPYHAQIMVGPQFIDKNQEESEEEEDNQGIENYDYETYKNRVLNSGNLHRVQVNDVKRRRRPDEEEDSEEDEDYVDPQVLIKDPALAEIIQKKQQQQQYQARLEIQKHHDQIQNLEQLPVSHELLLKGHTRAITSISLDQAGSRLCSGSYDYFTRLWDFQGMDKNMHSFRVIEPVEGHPVYQTSWSKDGKHVLVIAGDPQACVLDREGKRVLDTHKGDMYIRDMLKTNGHTSLINAGLFVPDYNNMFVTCSDDGTIRLWDVNQKLYGIAQQLANKDVVKCCDQKGQKCMVRNIGVRSGSNFCAATCIDGSMQVFSLRSQCLGINQRPQIIIRDIHKSHVSTIKLLKGDHYVITNSTDNSLKLWDLRMPKTYVKLTYFTSNQAPPSKFDLSSDESLLVMPNHHFTPSGKLEKDTDLVFYSTTDFSVQATVPMFNTAITDLVWHPVLNQIFVGGTDGDIRALFHPQFSTKGTLLCVARQPKYWHAENIALQRTIILPNNLPVFKEGLHKSKVPIIEKIKFDEEKKKIPRPEMPQNGPGKGGKISGASTVTQYLIRTQNAAPQKLDVREQLTKLDKETRRNPSYVLQAYEKTQPNTIYDYSPQDVQENILLSQLKYICPHCGMKICACHRKVV